MAVLDISKSHMYSFHYDFAMPVVGENNLKLMYGDTDSFGYHIKNQDIYEVIKKYNHLFDISDYPENNRYGIPCKKQKTTWII